MTSFEGEVQKLMDKGFSLSIGTCVVPVDKRHVPGYYIDAYDEYAMHTEGAGTTLASAMTDLLAELLVKESSK